MAEDCDSKADEMASRLQEKEKKMDKVVQNSEQDKLQADDKQQQLAIHLRSEMSKLEIDMTNRSTKTRSMDLTDVHVVRKDSSSREGTLAPSHRTERLSTSSDDRSTCTLEEGVSNSASVLTLEGKSESGSVCSDQSPDKMPVNDTMHNVARPDSLSFSTKSALYGRKRSKSDGQKLAAYINETESGIKEWRTCRSASTAVPIPAIRDPEFENIEETMLSKSMPHGLLLRKGEMIEFIAEDLQEKIRQSSPHAKTDSSGLSSRTSSLRSISSVSSSTSSAITNSMTSGMSRSPSSLFQQSPDDIPPIDPQALHDLEAQAKRVADNVDLMMGNLRSTLHKTSAITVGCLDAYKTSVDVTCDSVDSSIKAMYALMAKAEELSNHMGPVYKLADQIKEIKRLLDRFESQLADKT